LAQAGLPSAVVGRPIRCECGGARGDFGCPPCSTDGAPSSRRSRRSWQIAGDPVRLNQGSLDPALVRLEPRGWIKGTWRTTENNREARYYRITPAGSRELDAQIDRWQRSTGLVNRLLAGDEI
jgi:hypothetical protein